ncbi:MAG: hypothetical protein HY314_13445 [Acidobacteria bacterium]|nr:hypothetical protein [Acidobacteriota bacterium]
MKRAIILAALLLNFPSAGLAQGQSASPSGQQSDARAHWWQNFSLHGFLQGNFTPRIVDADCTGMEGCSFLLGEERLQLKLAGNFASGKVGLFIKNDFYHDAVANKVDVDLREAYFDSQAHRFGLRIGRQVITWGVGDLLFINDVFPKDWAAFFSGRLLEYLKLSSDAIKLDFHLKPASAELVVAPRFRRDNVPSGRRLLIFDLFPGIDRVIVEPATNPKNTEVALRVYRMLKGFDVAFYASKGFYHVPAMRPDALPSQRIANFFPRLAVYGASAQGNGLRGVLSFEVGYYHSLDDRSGRDPSIENAESQWLVGYQKDLGGDLSVGVQYYGVLMHDYASYWQSLPKAFPARDRYRQTLAVRVMKLLRYQTLKLSFFSIYNPNDADYFLNPEIDYKITDALSLTVGSNIFGGRHETTLFGQLDRNDNIYATLRYSF